MAIIRKYEAIVVSVTNAIEGIYTITFRSLAKPFKYEPGQFLHLALDAYDPDEQWPDSRCFSMQSSPLEVLIKITYAVKGNFTKRMETHLQPDAKVTLKLPYGDLFTQPHAKTNNVFIAGGTGITPFLSLFTHPSFAHYEKPVLFAGFRNKTMNLYETELAIARKINSEFTWHSIYEDTDGLLNIHDILKKQGRSSTFFISGPPIMIKIFKQFLINEGVSQSNVLTDDWE